jgi:hypothetical protein
MPLVTAGRAFRSVVVSWNGGYSSLGAGGLELAVWTDGPVVFAPDRSKPGVDLRVGRIPIPALERALSVCAGLGLFDRASRSEIGMHQSSTSVTLRRGDAHRTFAWDGTLADSAWYPRSAHRSFVTTGLLMEQHLESLVPVDSLPLRELVPDGALRGFRDR